MAWDVAVSLAVTLAIGAAGAPGLASAPRTKDVEFRIAHISDSRRERARFLIGVKNMTDRRLSFSRRGQPMIWNVGYEPLNQAQRKAQGWMQSVFTTTHTVLEGERYCPEDGEILALEPGNEVIVDATADIDMLKDGDYAVELGIVLLRVSEGGGCTSASYARGEAATNLRIRGDMVLATMKEPGVPPTRSRHQDPAPKAIQTAPKSTAPRLP